jgi:hypothetical protein
MQLPTLPKFGRLSRKRKITAAGAAVAAAAVLTVTGLQATGGTSAEAVGDPTGFSVSSGDKVKELGADTGMASQKAIEDQAAAQKKAAAEAAAKKKAAADAVAEKKAEAAAEAKKKAAAEAARKKAVAEAAKRAKARAAANRSEHRSAVKPATKPKAVEPKVVKKAAPAPKPVVTYANNLDGWIRHSLAIMAEQHIPGSYDGIYRNIIRESSGNPNAINLWDINAQNGIPSKGLLQVIDPTFQAYHVPGTSWNIYDPVANITAACNYAYHVYGSMDNVYSAY